MAHKYKKDGRVQSFSAGREESGEPNCEVIAELLAVHDRRRRIQSCVCPPMLTGVGLHTSLSITNGNEAETGLMVCVGISKEKRGERSQITGSPHRIGLISVWQ